MSTTWEVVQVGDLWEVQPEGGGDPAYVSHRENSAIRVRDRLNDVPPPPSLAGKPHQILSLDHPDTDHAATPADGDALVWNDDKWAPVLVPLTGLGSIPLLDDETDGDPGDTILEIAGDLDSVTAATTDAADLDEVNARLDTLNDRLDTLNTNLHRLVDRVNDIIATLTDSRLIDAEGS